jgi:hypothetical protein
MRCASKTARDHPYFELATDLVAGAPVLLALGFLLLAAFETGSLTKGLVGIAAAALAFGTARCAIWNSVCYLGSHQGCFVYLLTGTAAWDSTSSRSIVISTATFAAATALSNFVILRQLFTS